jgi:predicted lipoprotein with Yx(FWY)xxD motif
MKRSLPLLPLSVAAVIALAGCGGSSNNNSTAANASPSPAGTPKPSATAVDVRSSKLGKILVDAQGRTLYLFEKDKGPTSTCSGACASAWPPLTAAGPLTAGTGALKAKLGTTKRSDGTNQATYAGHPLYFYAGDTAPGQTTGQAIDQFGAEWYVLAPSGKKVDDDEDGS